MCYILRSSSKRNLHIKKHGKLFEVAKKISRSDALSYFKGKDNLTFLRFMNLFYQVLDLQYQKLVCGCAEMIYKYFLGILFIVGI